MPSPFPGMDPFLESPRIWPDVHHELISQIRAALNPRLGPEYVARIELRVYFTGYDDPGIDVIIPDVRIEERETNGPKKPRKSNGAAVAIAEPMVLPTLIDDEIKEAHLEIRNRDSNALVTIIELMSPANKIRGSRGRESFLAKKQETVASGVNWLEIDLLRAGVSSAAYTPLRECDYRVLRYRSKAKGCFWPIDLRKKLPVIGVPLRGKEADIPLDLGAVLNAAYDNAAYERSIDYRKEPEPPLKGADKTWADKLLRQRGLR